MIASGPRPRRFSLPSGRLRCVQSRSHLPGGASVAVDAALLGALRAWQRTGGSPDGPATPALTLAVRRFLGMFMQHHLDLPLVSRQAAFAWLDARP